MKYNFLGEYFLYNSISTNCRHATKVYSFCKSKVRPRIQLAVFGARPYLIPNERGQDTLRLGDVFKGEFLILIWYTLL